ncbi:MAG: hypothetical protein LBM02_01520, partial [Lachnospiraceae bacterium]|nr:hypothetical protein [Lachnospiraceae bacterium]
MNKKFYLIKKYVSAVMASLVAIAMVVTMVLPTCSGVKSVEADGDVHESTNLFVLQGDKPALSTGLTGTIDSVYINSQLLSTDDYGVNTGNQVVIRTLDSYITDKSTVTINLLRIHSSSGSVKTYTLYYAPKNCYYDMGTKKYYTNGYSISTFPGEVLNLPAGLTIEKSLVKVNTGVTLFDVVDSVYDEKTGQYIFPSQNWGSSNFGSFSLGIYTDKGMYVYKFEGSNNTTDSMVVSPSSITLDNNKENLTAVTHLYNFTGSDLANVLDGNGNSIDYSTDASTNGSSNYTLSNLQKLGNGSHEIIFKTKSGNTATFTVTLNGITAPTLTKYFDEYDATSPTTISTSLVTNGSTVNSITYSNTKFTDQPIGTTDVEITTTSSGKQYTFTDDFLKSLNNGVTTVNFNLKNGDVSYSLPFGIAVSKAAEAYKPGYENMVLEINNSDPVEWGDNSYDVSIRLGTYLDGTKDTFKGVYLVNDINSLDTSHPLNYTKKDSASYGSYDFDLSISNKEITDNYKLGNCYIMFEFSGEADFTHGFTLQSSIGMDSSGIFDFNTSSANSGDKTINITKNNSNVDPSKYTLDGTDITDKITDYTDNGTTATFIIPASYMSGLSKRDHTLTVDFNSGATATYKLKVQDSSATLSSESAVYNKDIHDTTNNNEPTVTLTTKDNGYTTDNQKEKLLGIKLDSETGYIDASNYTESNGKYTFKKDYLNTLSTKDHKFTFDMQGSADLTYTVKVMNTIKSSTISGSPAYYDKTAGYTNHENISAVLSLNGNIVNSVKDSNGKTLSADTDYTLSTDKTTYTFTYTYLDTLKDSANTLTFEMDQGGDLPFVINVNKSVNSTWYSAADESGMYDQNLSSLNNKDLTFYIKKGDNTISSIKNGSTPLSQTNGDYTVATVTHEGVSCYQVTLKKSYLQTASSTNLAIGFDQGGVTLYYALIVNNTTQDSELSAASATYDHTAGYPNSEQVSVTVTLKGNTVKEITDNGSKISNSAWSKQVSDDGLTETYTFAKTYLDNLTADKELKFVMDQGATKTELPFTIIYHKSVNSEFATAADSNGTFDKEVGNDANKDLTFKIKKGSNAFDKIMVGKNTLTSGTDGQYTISGPDTEGNYTITIKKDYLMTLPTDVKRSTGTAFDIYFNYGGDAAIRSYTVTVYETKSAEITGDTKGTFDKKAGSDNNKDIVITLDPGQNTFEGVKIDGNDINSSYYDYNNGVLTIKKDALKDLSNENHTITIGMSAGTNPEFTLKVTDTTDTDGDEVPDIQEEKDGTKANDPTDYKDSDGDGVPDFVEEKDGTDPEDSNDWKDKDHNGVPDYVDTHFPDESDDKDDDNKPDYQKDTDGDEVPDFVEGQQETDKNDASDFKDTDKDGVPDYVEDKDGTDKNDASKYKDTDGDEVPDYVENHKDNTDSKDATEYKDTDGDGVPDYVEDRDNTDKDDAISFKDESPKNDVPDYVDNHFPDKVADYTTDSDGDEVPDGVEDNQGTKTNDDKSYLDTDGDGVPDYVEDKDGTDEHNATEFTDDDKDGIPDYVERHDGNDNTNPGGDPSDPDDNTDYTKDT